MKRILAALALLGLSFVTAADSQVVPFPNSLPPNTVIGRLGISAGPAQAIPFQVLAANLPSQPFVNVLNYARGDCVTDDSTAIQLAINALPGGGTVYFPPAPGGCYAIGSGTAITLPANIPVTLMGAGRSTINAGVTSKGTILKATAAITSVITTTTTFTRGHRISNLTIDGNNNAQYCLKIDQAAASTFDNLALYNATLINFRLGDGITNTQENNLYSIRLDNPLTTVLANLATYNFEINGINNHITEMIAANAKTANVHSSTTASNNTYINVHGYDFFSGAAQAPTNNFLIDASGEQIMNWEADGSSSVNVQINGFSNILLGGISQFAAPLVAQKHVQFANATSANFVAYNQFSQATDVNAIVQAGAAGSGGNHYQANYNAVTGNVIANDWSLGVNGSIGATLKLFGLTSGNASIVPPAVAGTPTLTLPTSTGTLTESSVTTYATDGIIYGTGTSTLTNSDRCSMNSSGSIICASASTFSPQSVLTNTTSDTGNAISAIKKNRSGGNTLSGDGLGTFLFQGFANAAQQNSAQITASQTAASSGSNIPSKIELSTSNAGSGMAQILRFDQNAHLAVTGQATAPTISAGCNGIGSLVGIGSSDFAGNITSQNAAATTCTITFGTAFTNTPSCITSGDQSAILTQTRATGTLVVTFASTANYRFNWICSGI